MARNDVLGWIARQSQVQGLSLVDLNWPQHFEGLKLSQVCMCVCWGRGECIRVEWMCGRQADVCAAVSAQRCVGQEVRHVFLRTA